MPAAATVLSVHLSPVHKFSKPAQMGIVLREGLGVEGDAHCGATVQHRWDKRHDASKPNLRQVHLLQGEWLDDLAHRGFDVRPGELGENISTRGIDLLALPTGTQLFIGAHAVIELTGLRNPCVYIERFRKGLLAQMGGKQPGKPAAPKAGVMGVVRCGGEVMAGDAIRVQRPEGLQRALKPV